MIDGNNLKNSLSQFTIQKIAYAWITIYNTLKKKSAIKAYHVVITKSRREKILEEYRDPQESLEIRAFSASSLISGHQLLA